LNPAKPALAAAAFPVSTPADDAVVSNAPAAVANAQFAININKDFQRIFFVSFRAPQSARR
jgi:copper(I)-binding protein